MKDLTPDKKRLLSLLLNPPVPKPGIGRVRTPGPRRLSFAQERLWFLEQLGNSNGAYHIPEIVRLRGPLNLAALEAAFREVVHRHEILRTVYLNREGTPYQAVIADWDLTMPVFDLGGLPPDEQEQELRRMISQQTIMPFNLGRDLMLRVCLFALGKNDHVLLVVVHHIAFDGWSLGIFHEEIGCLYGVFRDGRPSPLAEPPIQYSDYAEWQRDQLQDEELARQLDYWSEELRSIPELRLPADRKIPSQRSHEGALCSRRLSPDLSRQLEKLSAGQDSTLFMALLAAFQVLLHRLSGQQDFGIGIPVANRGCLETDRSIGFFVNTLVIRASLPTNPTFTELLKQVREKTIQALSNQDVPFERLVETLQPERRLNQPPLFQVMFNLVNVQSPHLDLPGLDCESSGTEPVVSKFDLTLYASTGSQVSLELVYATELFDAPRIEEMLDQYVLLLQQIADDSTRPAFSYSLVTERSKKVLPDPAVALPEPEYKPVTELVRTQARNGPEQPAVTQFGRQWSYEELVSRADQIAAVLLEMGTRRSEAVAVMGQPCFGLICSIMGVMSSGAVLLTLDRDLPEKRLQVLLADSKVRTVCYVGQARAEDQWLDAGFTRLRIQEDSGTVIGWETGESPPELPSMTGEDPAYIFYTSGSTGTPKGVIGCHKGLSHFLTWQRDSFGIGPSDRIGLLTSLSFDAVMRDLFLPLVSGGTLCLPENGIRAKGRVLSWVQSERITVLHSVPSVARAWLDCEEEIRLDALAYLFLAGEPLTESLVLQWQARLPASARIINLYGATETTLVKCFHDVSSGVAPGVQPVGKPMPDTQAIILDPAGLLCGVGEPGEIWMRTPFRTLGYLNRPEEQKKAFIPNPFRQDARDLIYRTGDLARYRPDGSIDLQGRQDAQVKIKGVRVEPEEVEAILARHPQVHSSVVFGCAKGDETILTAYVVPRGTDSLTAEELRQLAATHLPTAMVPSRFVFLSSLPLSASGKIDRQALSRIPAAEPTPAPSFVAPRDEMEAQIARSWEQLLKKEPIGIRDDFFSLGGHSLMAVRLLHQVEQNFGANLPLTSLFTNATVESLAQEVRRQGGRAKWPSLVALQPSGWRPPLFCTHPFCGDVAGYRIWVDYLGEDQPFYGLRARGLDGVQEPLTSIPEMAAEYITCIRAVQPSGPYYLAGYGAGSITAFEMARQLTRQMEEVALLVIMNYPAPGTGFHEIHPGPRFLVDFASNLPYWTADFFDLRYAKLLYRLELAVVKSLDRFNGRSLVTVRAVEERLSRAARKAMDEHDIALLDNKGVPDEHYLRQVKVVLANRAAAASYAPGPYPGRVTLLKTHRQPLLCSFQQDLCWGQLAQGGVEIHMISGSTRTLLKQPHARTLGLSLREVLRAAQSRAHV
jgi:amino acid adenylation domain-containing protein